MAKALFLAWSDPVDEASEAEFSSWYEGTHIPQVRAAVPAVSAVHRYRTADVPAVPGTPAHRFLAVVGTSGSGKSSLVNCGLRPALHRGMSAYPPWSLKQTGAAVRRDEAFTPGYRFEILLTVLAFY